MARPQYAFNATVVPWNAGTVTVTIANGASLSGAGIVGNRKLLAIIVGTWTSAAISFDVSVDGTNYFAMYDEAGVEVTIPAGTHNKAYAVPLELLGFPYVKVRSGIIGALVNQSGGDDVILVVSQ